VFHALGYERLVAFELARLTTRLAESVSRYKQPQWLQRHPERYSIEAYRNRRIGHLPQGAATSPMLANLAMVECDRTLEELASAAGMTYTRYSDDLSFSTDASDFTRQSAERVVQGVYKVLGQVGLRPRTAKTAIISPGARKVILGLLVDGEKVRLTREFRRSLECHVHHICRHGPEVHARRRGFKSVLGLRRHLQGLLSHAAAIDQEFASSLRQQLSGVIWPV
jgi:RNA-directed DNA polymerase